MLNKSPAFQFYPADYVSDMNLILMSNQQGGCYWKLMCQEWLANGKGIPKEVNQLAKICGEPEEEMALLWEGIEPCFKPHPKDPTKLIHPRLEKERKKQKENKKRRVSAGKKGAKARWQSDSNAIDLPLAKDSSSSSTSTSSSTSVKKPLGEKKPVKADDEITDTTKALRAWVTEYEAQIKDFPDFSPARDNSILKLLVKTHGLQKVLDKIPYHISERKYLSIPGFQTCFNTLGINNNQTRGAKKKQALEDIEKKLEAGDVIEMVQPRRINA